MHRGAAVAHKVRSYKGDAGMGMADQSCRSALCGSAPCARQTYGAVHPSVAVAHRVRSHRQAGVAEEMNGAMPKADAQRGPAL